MTDAWDETQAQAGVEKVNNWLEKEMDDNKKHLIGIIRGLLKPNKDGVLNSKRVMSLSCEVKKIGDAELIEAVEQIVEDRKSVV